MYKCTLLRYSYIYVICTLCFNSNRAIHRVAAAASGMVDGYGNVRQTQDGGLAAHRAAAAGAAQCGHA